MVYLSLVLWEEQQPPGWRHSGDTLGKVNMLLGRNSTQEDWSEKSWTCLAVCKDEVKGIFFEESNDGL